MKAPTTAFVTVDPQRVKWAERLRQMRSELVSERKAYGDHLSAEERQRISVIIGELKDLAARIDKI